MKKLRPPHRASARTESPHSVKYIPGQSMRSRGCKPLLLRGWECLSSTGARRTRRYACEFANRRLRDATVSPTYRRLVHVSEPASDEPYRLLYHVEDVHDQSQNQADVDSKAKVLCQGLQLRRAGVSGNEQIGGADQEIQDDETERAHYQAGDLSALGPSWPNQP